MKAKLFFITVLTSIFSFTMHAQSLYAETQIVEFSNINSGNNYSSGDIYCFDNTKVVFQLRTLTVSGNFNGNILFNLSQDSYTASNQDGDYFREVVLTLPKGKTKVSISVIPDANNTNPANASILIFSTNKGTVGTKNIISTGK